MHCGLTDGLPQPTSQSIHQVIGDLALGDHGKSLKIEPLAVRDHPLAFVERGPCDRPQSNAVWQIGNMLVGFSIIALPKQLAKSKEDQPGKIRHGKEVGHSLFTRRCRRNMVSSQLPRNPYMRFKSCICLIDWADKSQSRDSFGQTFLIICCETFKQATKMTKATL